MRHSIEAVEDDAVAGQRAMQELGVGERDVVMGIAAGGTTPYVHGALVEAAGAGRGRFFWCVRIRGMWSCRRGCRSCGLRLRRGRRC